VGRSESIPATRKRRTFLFLQGPLSPFFRLLADALERRGHRVLRINLCFGDWLFWRRPGATNYRGSLKRWPDFISAYLNKEGVTDLLLLGEQRDYHKIAINAAKKLGVDVTVTDFGYLRPDWITLERDGMTGASVFPRDPATIRTIARSVLPPDLNQKYRDSFRNMAAWDMLYHLSSTLLRPLYPLFQWHHVHHPIFVYLGIGLHLLLNRLRRKHSASAIQKLWKSGAPYYVYPLQMQNDFSIRAYSHYDDQREAIREVLESFARYAPAASKLVIRVHPLDPLLYDWQDFCRRFAIQNGMLDRIAYIDGGPLVELLQHARGVVTINSTVGIWTLRVGRPLMTLGEAIFDIKGLTFQEELDKFWTECVPPDPQLRDDFIRAIAGTIQIRGVYYNQPGLDAAVAEAVERLDRGLINQPLTV
jgi:capsular polysaccharide export protein